MSDQERQEFANIPTSAILIQSHLGQNEVISHRINLCVSDRLNRVYFGIRGQRRVIEIQV